MKTSKFKHYVSEKIAKNDFSFSKEEVSLLIHFIKSDSGASFTSSKLEKVFMPNASRSEISEAFNKISDLYHSTGASGFGVKNWKNIITKPQDYSYDPRNAKEYTKVNFKIKYGWEFDDVFTNNLVIN